MIAALAGSNVSSEAARRLNAAKPPSTTIAAKFLNFKAISLVIPKRSNLCTNLTDRPICAL